MHWGLSFSGLRFCGFWGGASDENFGYAQAYLLWVVVLGGIPTMLSMTLAHLLRSEGYARKASAGMMFGGKAMILTLCRQGLLNIPCLLVMNWLVGLNGMIWAQLIIEALMLPVTMGMYRATSKRLPGISRS